jgi:hypothetical protein
MNPEGLHFLTLNPAAIVEGREYWRLLTFLFIPPMQNPLFTFFFLYLLYVYGSALETEWGSFSFTLFYLCGAMGTVVAAFFFGGSAGAFYLNTSLFLAFAAVHPDFELLFFFVIPLKIKWLALATWVWFGYLFLGASIATKASLLVSFINYFLFFGPVHFASVRDMIVRTRHRRRFKDWSD